MSIEEDKQLLLYHAAVAVLRPVNIPAVKEIIKRLIDAGIYHDTFIDVEYPKSDTTQDFIPALTNALSSLGLSAPVTTEEATRIIIRKHLTDIVEHKITPFDGLDHIVYTENLDLVGSAKKYVGDYYHIEQFVGDYWGYRDAIDVEHTITSEQLAEAESIISARAIEWLKSN